MKKKTSKILLVTALLLTITYSRATIAYTDIPDAMLSESNPNFSVDFENNGSMEFSFTYMMGSPSIILSQTNHIATLADFSTGKGWDVIKGFTFGTPINSNAGFFDMGDAYIDPSWAIDYSFPKNQDTYLACQFVSGNKTYYGWIRVNWNGSNLLFKDYAYENTPNSAIKAGDKGQNTANLNQLDENSVAINLYPNPASDVLKIHSPNFSFDELRIFDFEGKEVLHRVLEDTNEISINISSMEKGQYFVRIGKVNDHYLGTFNFVKF
jgi:hypothetical protein